MVSRTRIVFGNGDGSSDAVAVGRSGFRRPDSDHEALLTAPDRLASALLEALEFNARGIRYRVNRRPHPTAPLSERWRAINRVRSRTRVRGEHPFHVVKRPWGFAKVRYRGLAKNTALAFALFALANIYLVRRQLLLRRGACSEDK